MEFWVQRTVQWSFIRSQIHSLLAVLSMCCKQCLSDITSIPDNYFKPNKQLYSGNIVKIPLICTILTKLTEERCFSSSFTWNWWFNPLKMRHLHSVFRENHNNHHKFSLHSLSRTASHTEAVYSDTYLITLVFTIEIQAQHRRNFTRFH